VFELARGLEDLLRRIPRLGLARLRGRADDDGMAREWKPSKRASELIDVLWDGFLDGDRSIRILNASTARYTGVSLVYNGIAEWVDQDARRIRLSSAYLEANGIQDRDWATEAATFAQWDAEDAEAAEYQAELDLAA
jgi:hypothetical protein